VNLNSLVTGGVCGIGRGIVERLLKRGDNLFVFDVFPASSEKVKQLESMGVNYFRVDVSCVDSIRKGFDQIEKVDLLVNNAGVTKDNLAIRMSEQDWDFVLNVNLKGAFFCCQQAVKKMIKQKFGYIVNISSIVGQVGNPGQANYAASKAGVIALTKSLAQEYASRNVLVNAIAPGFIQTEMTDKIPQKFKELALQRISLRKFGTPKDVAEIIGFLSSGCADYITGQIFNVDGGMF